MFISCKNDSSKATDSASRWLVGTGFQLKFANGNTVSIQWGGISYSSRIPDKKNKQLEKKFTREWKVRFNDDEPEPDMTRAITAEMAAWNTARIWHTFDDGDNVQGWRTPEQVAEFINFVAHNKLNTKPEGGKDDSD